jgi:2-haloacid dehalogenase
MLLVLDVNETLLDVSALDPVISEVVGVPGDSARRTWFDRMIRSAMAITAAGGYLSFGAIAVAALRDLAAELGRELSDAQGKRLAAGMRALPAHPDVVRGLGRLRDDGHRIVTLTNSVLDVAEAQLGSSGLIDLVDAVYSADEVQRLKPAGEPYRMVLAREGTDSAMLVAAHDWDVTGAALAGLETAFLAREGRRPFSAVAEPRYVADDLLAFADLLHGPDKS